MRNKKNHREFKKFHRKIKKKSPRNKKKLLRNRKNKLLRSTKKLLRNTKKSPCGYHLVHLHVSHHVDHLVHLHDGHLVHLHVVHLVHPHQALTGSRISIPGFFGTGFSNIFDPGILGKTFGIFIFTLFACQIG